MSEMIDENQNENKSINIIEPEYDQIRKPKEQDKQPISFVSQGKIEEQNGPSINEISGEQKEIPKLSKKVSLPKKPRPLIEDFTEFIPEPLLMLNQVKSKSLIRIGQEYQADVPQKTQYYYKYRPLNNLKIWSARDINPSILAKFREKFGQARSEEDLCLLMYQYQCNWDQLTKYLLEHKNELRKLYLSKDRTKPM